MGGNPSCFDQRVLSFKCARNRHFGPRKLLEGAASCKEAVFFPRLLLIFQVEVKRSVYLAHCGGFWNFDFDGMLLLCQRRQYRDSPASQS